MRTPILWIITGASLALGTGASFADTVSTTDGSLIVGRIVKLCNGKLVIETEFAGELTVDAGKIASITTDRKVNVEFTSGDRLVGVVKKSSERGRPVVETEIGTIPIDVARIKAVWPVGEESPEIVAIKAEVEAAKEALTPKWTVTLEAGGNRTEGNTDTLEGRGGFTVLRRSPDDLLKFYASADYTERDDERNRNEYKGGTFYEQLITDRWNWYTRFELEYDEFENLDLRATVAAGTGFYWLKEPNHELGTRAGAGYRHESYTDDLTSDAAVLDFGLDYRLDLLTWARFTHSTTYSPAFEDFDDYRLTVDNALVIPLGNTEGWKLKLGVLEEYNSQPRPGLERLDSTYYANIVMELKQP